MVGEYHGILLDVEFQDPGFISKFEVFASKKSTRNRWTCYGVSVPGNKIDETVKEVQEQLVPHKPYYAHFYRDGELIVVFKDRVFRLSQDRRTWGDVIDYGLSLGIPREQLDFKPARFQDEDGYFTRRSSSTGASPPGQA